jgi:hypothetical protein
MARKEQPEEAWINSEKAAEILTKKTDHTVKTAYVRLLASHGKIRTQKVDDRTKLYSREDAEAYTVRQRGDGSVRRAVRAPRGTKTDSGKQEREEAIA